MKYKGDDHIYYLHEYNLDYPANEIYLVGEDNYNTSFDEEGEPGVEHLMSSRFIKNLNLLSRKSGDPILIHQKTNGGYWEEGMAIFNAIQACPNYVTILNYTHARSMSSITFLAADHKVMMEDSVFMLHEGTFSFEGTVKQFRTEGKELSASGNRMLQIYIDCLKNSKHGSKRNDSRAKIKKWLIKEMDRKEEVYFSAKETVALGFADEIFDGDLKKIMREV